MRKCVLFDFDGVLVDSEWRLFCQIREWLTKEYRITMPDSDCMRYIGGNDEATARDLIARYALPVGVEALAGQISAHSTLYEDGTLTLLPGAREFLVSLRRQGVRTGLVSSTESRHILAAANHLGLTGLFEVMICGDMVACHKPDPEGYRRAMALLGAAPGDCLILEDSAAGLRAAKAAGAYTVGFCGARVRQDVSDADACVVNYAALMQPAVRRALDLPAAE